MDITQLRTAHLFSLSLSLQILQEKMCALVQLYQLLLCTYAYLESFHQQKQHAAQKRNSKHDVWCDKCTNIWNTAIFSSTPALFPI